MIALEKQIHENNPLIKSGFDLKKTDPSKISFTEKTGSIYTPQFVEFIDNYNKILNHSLTQVKTVKYLKQDCISLLSVIDFLYSINQKLFTYFDNFEIDKPIVFQIINKLKTSDDLLLELKKIITTYLEIIEAKEDFESGNIISLEEAFNDV